jgi:hypothetical protein
MVTSIISCPSGLCFSGNLPKLTLTADADVRIRLDVGASLEFIFRTLLDETYTPDFSRVISLDLSEVVHNALKFTMPTADPFVQPEILRTFRLVLNDFAYFFSAIRTGVKRLNVAPVEFLSKNFLTWQPPVKEITDTQPEWLTCYPAQNGFLFVTATLAGHSTVSKKMAILTAGKVYTFDTSVEHITALVGARPVRYDVYVVATDNPSALQLNTQIYRVVNSTDNERFYCFQNSLGGLDTVRCTGEIKHAPEYTPSTALMNDDVEDVYHIEKKDVTTQTTGWLDKAARAWLHDFFMSKQRHKYEDNALQAVVIDEVTAETSTTEDLIAFEFTYREATASIYLNLKHNSITTTATWAGYVNVLKKVCFNAFNHDYSRAFNCTSPEAPGNQAYSENYDNAYD